MQKSSNGFSLNDYKPVGSGHCQAKCVRESFNLKMRVLVVCHGCKRVLINKEKK